MSWFVSMVMTSMLGAVLAVKILDLIMGGIVGPAVSAAKTSLFVSAWTAITTGLGVRGMKKAARNLRAGGKGVSTNIDRPLKGKQRK